MAKFKFKELIGAEPFTTRLGVGSVNSTPANAYTDKEIGKFAKLSGTDAYVLCVVGDPIQAVITAVESYTADDFSMGSVDTEGRKRVLLDGSEAAGTGSIAIGDYVVAGTPVPKDTALTPTTPPKVRKATQQPGVTVPTTLTEASQQVRNAIFAWRLISFDSAGAVGDFGIIERVTC